MQALKRLQPKPLSSIAKTFFNNIRAKSSKSISGDDEWNDAWETAWLPEDLSAKNRAPWETDVNFAAPNESVVLPSDADAETKAFVEEMDENWNERKAMKEQQQQQLGNIVERVAGEESLGDGVKNMERDYRLKKQRIHAGLWMKEIEKEEEARLSGGGDDIDRLLDSCSEIFDSGNNGLIDSKIPSSSEFKTKPDGWETTTKAQDGNIWEISQREQDILLQEFERRIAFSKFQIASFIKSHIFSRRRPIDGWKYMIEEIGPNARRGKGSVPKLAMISDASTQPYKEDKRSVGSNLTPYKRK